MRFLHNLVRAVCAMQITDVGAPSGVAPADEECSCRRIPSRR
jgi:hypothetical protein